LKLALVIDVFGLRPAKHLPVRRTRSGTVYLSDREVRERPPLRRLFRYLLNPAAGALKTIAQQSVDTRTGPLEAACGANHGQT
jgi:hypothetical protein